jgi:hypothetical protein
MIGDWVGYHVGVLGEQSIGSLLPDGLVDVESLGLIIASLLSESLVDGAILRQAIGSLLLHGLVDGEGLGLSVASLPSE